MGAVHYFHLHSTPTNYVQLRHTTYRYIRSIHLSMYQLTPYLHPVLGVVPFTTFTACDSIARAHFLLKVCTSYPTHYPGLRGFK